MNRMATVTALVLLGRAASAQNPDADLRGALEQRVDQAHRAVGMVAGIVDAEGTRYIARGRVSRESERTPDAATVFEIGSITKVFTALLLADMVQRNEVSLDDPVEKFLPEGVKVPARGGRAIQLRDLAMHVSGLPRLPPDFKPVDPANPYAAFDATVLYGFLNRYSLPRDIGQKHEYSNLGAGLLGHALARKAGMSYETLARKRIFEPLGMTSTSVTLSPELKARAAAGHDAGLDPVPMWDLAEMAGAGAIRSTAADMLRFAAAHLELTATPLAEAMRLMRSVRVPGSSPRMQQELGWLVLEAPGGAELRFHNGGTGGFRSALALDFTRKRAAVVWANTFVDVDDLALHALAPTVSLATLAPRPAKAVAVDEKILETYTGEYLLVPGFSLTITREGPRLFVQATAQPKFELFAESDTAFYLKAVEARITFTRSAEGPAAALTLHQAGAERKAERVVR